MIDVSICVCTFRRPDGLRRLLQSLQRLDPASPTHEIIVVDNDAAMSGEPSVRQAQADGLAVRYRVEPLRSIARARNRSVEPASGEYVAFIDDDEEADPFWLVHLHAEVTRQGADGGIGPVVPRFNQQTPAWLIAGGYFDRPRPDTGTALAAYQARTGNALIRRQRMMALRGPFDERYALSGGEDTDLFAQLIDGGCRIIAVDSAIVYEHLPPERTTVRWLLRRRFLNGVGAAQLYACEVPSERRPRWQRARPLASGIAWSVAGVLLFPFFRSYALTRLVLAANYLGRFAFHSGFSFRPYA
ncbi:MAG: glycosyltransferase family 2 protein [bacterium]